MSLRGGYKQIHNTDVLVSNPRLPSGTCRSSFWVMVLIQLITITMKISDETKNIFQ